MSTQSVIVQIALLLILAAVIFYVLVWPRWRVRRILSRPVPESWLNIVRRRLPYYDRLPAGTQRQLWANIRMFLADKRFVGCAGQSVDDEIRVTIAAQACLLLLNRPTSCYRELRSILIYPSTFVATRDERDELGLVSTTHTALLGESWDHGKVVLAWDSVENGVLDLRDGYNVVLHEFAHQLDHESGTTNGAPILNSRGDYVDWSRVLAGEFALLQQAVERHEPTVLDAYGATDPAEFFAVATETFFEKPAELKERHPTLYQELKDYYCVDPASWQ
ncbi:MAG: M90 family metallopeptidase [Pseudohongiellaceae bacterium]